MSYNVWLGDYCTQYMRNEFKEMLNYLRRYAISRFNSFDSTSVSDIHLYTALCHKAFYEVQNKAFRDILFLESQSNDTNNELLIARKIKDKEKVYKLLQKKNSLKNQVSIIRKYADSIAWQLINQRHYIARRFLLNKEPNLLSTSNWECVLSYVNHYNQDNPQSFALASDITSFIQIGDVFISVRENGHHSYRTVELKEGEVNEKIKELLDFLKKIPCERAVYYFSKMEGQKATDQLQRTLRQYKNLSDLANLINKGKGIDPSTKTETIISNETIALDDYDILLDDMLSKANKVGYDLRTIQDCLYIGAFKAAYPSTLIFQRWAQPNPLYPLIDLRYSFSTLICYPLTIRNISDQNVENLTLGNMVVYLYLDLDRFIGLSVEQGFTGRWLSHKETARCRERFGKGFEINNQCIEFIYNNNVIHLDDGILSRIFFDGVTPKSAISLLKGYLTSESFLAE